MERREKNRTVTHENGRFADQSRCLMRKKRAKEKTSLGTWE